MFIVSTESFCAELHYECAQRAFNPYMPEFLFCEKVVINCCFWCDFSIFSRNCAMAAQFLYLEHQIAPSQKWDARTERVGVFAFTYVTNKVTGIVLCVTLLGETCSKQ